jgi:RNA polymerase sigma-70 factor (ECF subfamily)
MRCVPRILVALNRRAASRLGPEELADLTQDTLTTIWRRLDTFEGRAALESWVFRVCAFEMQNRLRGQARAERRRAHGERAELGADPPSSPLDFDHVHRGLDRLGPPECDIIRLRHFEELSFEEIGARLALSANTAKSYYYRGLTRLRRLLSSQSEAGGA